MTNPRTLAAVALASGAFGGAIGAMATAAVQSQASPAAIAAAIQKVQDQNAERSVAAMNTKLGSVDTSLKVLARGLSGGFDTPLYQVEENLFNICLHTSTDTSLLSGCPAPRVVTATAAVGH